MPFIKFPLKLMNYFQQNKIDYHVKKHTKHKTTLESNKKMVHSNESTPFFIKERLSFLIDAHDK